MFLNKMLSICLQLDRHYSKNIPSVASLELKRHCRIGQILFLRAVCLIQEARSSPINADIVFSNCQSSNQSTIIWDLFYFNFSTRPNISEITPQYHSNTMKSYLVLFVTALATTALASPYPEAGLEERATCKHPGECGWTNSGQCEYHCDGYGGFDFMQDCGWKRKRCCCNKAT
jgi:hypothetical protein